MDQPAPPVNPIEIGEIRMSAIQFMPALSVLRSRPPSHILGSSAASEVEFQKLFTRVLTGDQTLLPPWGDGYGKLFWTRYIPDREVRNLWRMLTPIQYNLRQLLVTVTLPEATVAIRAYLYPWGVGIAIDITLTGPFELASAVNRVIEVRTRPVIKWTLDTGFSASSTPGLLVALRERLSNAIYGSDYKPVKATDIFNLITVTDGSGVVAVEPIEEGGSLHRALDGMTGTYAHWNETKPDPLAQCTIASRRAPVGHVLYGKQNARVVWSPADFKSTASYPDTLSCYHQNLTVSTMHTQALCCLAQDAAAELRAQESLDNLSTAYRSCAQFAAGRLGVLHGRKSDDSKDQKPDTYRSGSIRDQIQVFKEDIDLLRKSFPTIGTGLDL